MEKLHGHNKKLPHYAALVTVTDGTPTRRDSETETCSHRGGSEGWNGSFGVVQERNSLLVQGSLRL